MKYYQSIKFKTNLIVTCSIFALLILAGIITSNNFSNHLTRTTYDLAKSQLQSTVNKINAYIGEKMAIPKTMSQDENIRFFAKETKMRFYFTGPKQQSQSEIDKEYNVLPENIKQLAATIPEATAETERDQELVKNYHNLLKTLKRLEMSDPELILSYVAVENTQDFYCQPEVWVGKKSYYLRNRPWYLQAIKSKSTSMTDPYIDGISGDVVVTAATPMYDNNKLIGATAIDLSINTIIEQVKLLKLNISSFAYLAKPDGTVVAHENAEYILKANILNHKAFPEKIKDEFEAIKSGKTNQFEYTQNDKSYVVFTNKIESTGWLVFLIADKSEILAPIRQQTYQFIILLIVMIAVIGGLLTFLINRILKPLDIVVKASQSISNGDISTSLDTELLKRNDEIGSLAIMFESMIQSLKNKVNLMTRIADKDLTVEVELISDQDMMGKTLHKMSLGLNENINTIANGTRTLFNSTNNVLSASDDVTASTHTMMVNADTVANASTEITASIGTIASSSEEMSIGIESISATSTQMSQNVNDISDSMEGLSAAIIKVSDKSNSASGIAVEATEKSNNALLIMSALNQSAMEIGEVTAIIKEIAQQTNLLALNANIEAASAGDAGKGFAVVANEIKELAVQSATSAEDIAKKIAVIQKNTTDSEKSMKEVSQVITTVSDASNDISEYAKEGANTVEIVVASIKESAIGVSNIAKMISEMASTANESAKSSAELTKGANDISKNIAELNQQVVNTAKNMNHINSETQNITNLAEELNNVVKQFKIKTI